MKKMIMTVVPRDEAEFVLNALIYAGYTATFTESQGGMLRQAQLMMYIAVDEEQMDEVLEIIRENCRTKVIKADARKADKGDSIGPVPVTAELGGAVVFTWDINSIQTF